MHRCGAGPSRIAATGAAARGNGRGAADEPAAVPKSPAPDLASLVGDGRQRGRHPADVTFAPLDTIL
jgi:hypothetical protein